MPVSSNLKLQIHAQFGNRAGEVVRILEAYGSEDGHHETDRVHAAILKLAKGDVESVQSLTDTARRDYRDVLDWLKFDKNGNPPPLPSVDAADMPQIPPELPGHLLARDILLTVLRPGTAELQVVGTTPSFDDIRRTVYGLEWDDITFVTVKIDDDNWLDGSGSLNPQDGLSGMCSIGGTQYVTRDAPSSLDEIVELLDSFARRDHAWRIGVAWT